MGWSSEIEQLEGESGRKVTLLGDGRPLTYAEVIDGWRQEDRFCAFFSDLLQAAPFPACFWETPPVTAATVGQVFQCVQIDSPALARMAAEPAAFADHFTAAPGAAVVAFENLGRDAWLVVPSPPSEGEGYPHLAAFLRSAPAAQKKALWRTTGETLARLLSDRPRWVSTSGLGVAWLHVRLDTRPKYYVFAPYRQSA